jgi:hypothetical protein
MEKQHPLTATVDGNKFVIDLGLVAHVKSWSPKKIKNKVNWSDSWFQEIVGMYKRLTGTTYCMSGNGMISESHLESIAIIKEIFLRPNRFIVSTSKESSVSVEWIMLFKYDGQHDTYLPYRMSYFQPKISMGYISDAGYNDGH